MEIYLIVTTYVDYLLYDICIFSIIANWYKDYKYIDVKDVA